MSKTQTIATKVTTETLAALEALAASRGTSVYELVLSAIMMLLRLGSKRVALSDTVKRSWHAFEHEYGSLSSANLATLKQQDIIIEDAIYRVRQKGKDEATLMHMGRSFFDQSGKVELNHETIVSMVLRTAYPKTWQLLKEIQQDRHLPSIMGAITHLINEYHGDMIEEQIEELFSDNARAENTRDINSQQPYKRKNNKTINSKQYTMSFDEQGQELQQTDQPHGVEATQFEDEEGI